MNKIELSRRINKQPIDLAPNFDCPAITRCCDAWYRTFEDTEARGINRVSVRLRANEAYRGAMPPLSSLKNVRDFVACVAHGLIIGSIVDSLADRLLVAARFAAASFNAEARAVRRTPKNPSTNDKQPTHPITEDEKNPAPGCEAVTWSLDDSELMQLQENSFPGAAPISVQFSGDPSHN